MTKEIRDKEMRELPPKDTPFFSIYRENAILYDRLPDEQAAQLIKYQVSYFLRGEDTAFDDPILDAVRLSFRENVDRSREAYQKKRNDGQRGGKTRQENALSKLKDTLVKSSMLEDTQPTEHNTTEPNTTNHSTTEQTSIRKSVKRAGQNIPPSIDEVKAYCEERHNGIDAAAFIDYYEARAWMLGKVKMRNWQAAIRTWEKHPQGLNTAGNEPKPKRDYTKKPDSWRGSNAAIK